MHLRILLAETPVGDFSMAIDDTDVVLAASFGDVQEVIKRLPGVFVEQNQLSKTTEHPYISAVHDYFSGRPEGLGTIKYRQYGTKFQQAVWQAMSQIPYGQTASYADLAGMIGNPKAVRAVGSACARNPVPLIVPCHRVTKSNGDIGRYAFGIDTKRFLLQLEKASTTPPLDHI